jgi:hypothetical protein
VFVSWLVVAFGMNARTSKCQGGLGTMSKNTDDGHGKAEKPGDSSERLDNPPLWSPWNFQNKQRDWHEDFYDEMHSSASHEAEK